MHTVGAHFILASVDEGDTTTCGKEDDVERDSTRVDMSKAHLRRTH